MISGIRVAHALIAMVVAMSMLAGARTAGAEDAAVGRVIQQEGDIRVVRNEKTAALAVGASILRHDRILSGSGGRIKIEFLDHSLVALGSDTDIRIADYAVGSDRHRLTAVLSLLSGIVRAVVAEPGGSFDITSRAAVASARSTEWLMEAAGKGSAVFAAAGTVAVLSVATNAAVELTPGLGTDVPSDGAPTPPKMWGKARVDDFVARTRLAGE